MNYNRLSKFLIILISILFLANSSFAIGVYTNSGDFVYYMNNENPTISINISSPLEDIDILGAKIVLNGEEKILNSFETIYLGPSSSRINTVLEFTLPDFEINSITLNDNLYFILDVKDLNGDKIKPNGDPVEFKIQLDTTKPRLISFENKNKIVLGINGGYDIDFIFSKKISSYIISINNELYKNYTNPSNFEKDYLTQDKMIFSSDILNEGENNFTIKYFDLAGNFKEISMPIYFRGEDLELKLLTIRDDSTLKYNYNENYPSLFQNTIYTKSDIFDLKLETSKESICYFSNSLISFDYFEKISRDNLEIFSSTDFKIHSINIDITQGDNIWVFCKNKVYTDDSLYLSDVLEIGKNLINIKKFESVGGVKITSITPDGVATYSPVDLSISTSLKAVCSYSYNNADFIDLISSNLLSHTQSLSLDSGIHQISFSCIDVLNNIDSKSISLNVDLGAGVQISNQNPEYTAESSVDLEFSISENSECRYSVENVNPQDFPNLELTGGENLMRIIPMSNLAVGNNSVYLLCRKGSGIGKKKINVVFDPEGPKISNVRFVNNGIESSYVGSYSKIQIRFDIETLTPMKKYLIKLSGDNISSTLFYNSSSNDIILTGDFQDANSIQIIGENIIDKTSLEVNKNLLFDVETPEVKIIFNKNFVGFECFDVGGSGCLNILYELSKTSVCLPTKTYYKNISVDVTDNNYVCAKVTDKAGNSKTKLEPIIFKISNILDDTIIFDDNQNDTENTSVENSTTELEYVDDTNMFENTESNFDDLNNDSSINYILITAIALVLVGIGSGSYYAYKKGYLNNELKKLGIKLPKNISDSNNKKFSFSNSRDTSTNTEGNGRHIVSKSNYDKHKNRLNNFLDTQIGKGDKLFNKFDSKSSSKSKILDNFKSNKSKVSKEDVDDFYNSSLIKDNSKKMSGDIKVDANDFEEYYKKKKKKSVKSEKK